MLPWSHCVFEYRCHIPAFLSKFAGNKITVATQTELSSLSDGVVSKLKNPVFQALVLLATIVVIDLCALLCKSAGISIEDRFPWTVTASFMLFFAILNSLVSILAKNREHYWSRSILCYMALAAAAGGVAYLFSSLSINEAGSYRWLYIVLTIGYLVFLSIVSLIRTIVELAQREEWNQPKIRRKR